MERFSRVLFLLSLTLFFFLPFGEMKRKEEEEEKGAWVGRGVGGGGDSCRGSFSSSFCP